MRKWHTKLIIIATAAGSVAALPATALAKHGADDPAGHVRHGNGTDDRAGHHRHGNGNDDGAGHQRHGNDDGPNHR